MTDREKMEMVRMCMVGARRPRKRTIETERMRERVKNNLVDQII